MTRCKIGCAGWSLPKDLREDESTHLERYSRIFNCVEINSSFYRHHKPQTYERWSAIVPAEFRFSVKVPKLITHEAQLGIALPRFLNEVVELGEKLGALLVQFPPKASFNDFPAKDLFIQFRKRFAGEIVCEPRHSSWFESESRKLLEEYSISIVGADPKPVENAPDIFKSDDIRYFRLHGAPKFYYSEYSKEFLFRLSTLGALQNKNSWVIFDNTALGHAFRNAMELSDMLQSPSEISL